MKKGSNLHPGYQTSSLVWIWRGSFLLHHRTARIDPAADHRTARIDPAADHMTSLLQGVDPTELRQPLKVQFSVCKEANSLYVLMPS